MDLPVWNTVAVAVRAGTLTVAGDGTATLERVLTDDVNLALDPRLLLGPQLAAVASSGVPSGLAGAILTDTFMRPATVLPQVPMTALPQRLLAIAQAAIAQLEGGGVVAAAAVAPGMCLAPQQMNRVAITVEPEVRATPLLLPTEQNVVLVGLTPAG